MDNRMRMVLYQAFIAWSAMGVWIASVRYRIRLIEYKKNQIN
jgi:heme exporter protein C